MAPYRSPVDRLLTLGEAKLIVWRDYSALGIGPDDIPELIRLLQDTDLVREGEAPAHYGQVHAWRALAQLKSEAAIEPLLDLLAGQEDDDAWDDWISEGVPVALGRIGPEIFEPTAARLEVSSAKEHAPVYYSKSLAELAKHYPEMRDAVVQKLTAFLDHAADNDPSVNGFVAGYLTDLEAEEAWPVIERAFANGHVDESIVGDSAEVKWELGLGPKPIRNEYLSIGSGHRDGFVSPASAKARAAKRAKKKTRPSEDQAESVTRVLGR